MRPAVRQKQGLRSLILSMKQPGEQGEEHSRGKRQCLLLAPGRRSSKRAWCRLVLPHRLLEAALDWLGSFPA